MSNINVGKKRICTGCGARFYDLGKNPAQCPKCKVMNDINAPVKIRRKAKAVIEIDNDDPLIKQKNKQEALKKSKKISKIEGVNLDDFDDISPIGDDEIEELEDIENLESLEENGDDEDEDDIILDDEAILDDIEEIELDEEEVEEEEEEENDSPLASKTSPSNPYKKEK